MLRIRSAALAACVRSKRPTATIAIARHLHATTPHHAPLSKKTRHASSVPVPQLPTPTAAAAAAAGAPGAAPSAHATAGTGDPSVRLPPFSWRDLLFLTPNPPASPRSVMHRCVFAGVETLILAASGVAASGVTMLLHQQLSTLPVGTFDALDLFLIKNSIAIPAVGVVYFMLQALTSRFLPSVMRPLPAVVDSWAGARTRPSWSRVLLIVAGGVVVQMLVQHFVGLRDSPNGAEEPILIEVSMDRRPVNTAILALIGPVAEEVVFRVFLFARCARFMGVGPGLVVSSALFGIIHWSQSSDKVVTASLVGAVFAGVYRLAQTPLAPIFMHATNNAFGVMSMGALSPLQPFEDVAKTLSRTYWAEAQIDRMHVAEKRPILKAANATGVLEGPNAPPVDVDEYVNVCVWLENDMCTLRPGPAALVDSLFEALDRGGKGYLSPAEFAYADSLSTGRYTFLNAVLGVVERRLGDNDPAIDTARRHLEQAPSLAEPIALPSSHFFTPQQRDQARAQIAATYSMFPSLAQQLPPPRWQQMSPMHGLRTAMMQRRMVPADEELPLPHPLQRQMFERYYAHHAIELHDVCFKDAAPSSVESNPSKGSAAPSGVCDRAAFTQLISDNLVRRPTSTAQWLSAMAEVLQTQHEHPTAQLLDAHDRGERPGYRGVLVVRQAQKSETKEQ